MKHHETLLKHARISAFNVETSALGTATSVLGTPGYGNIGACAEFPAISAWSFRRYRLGVSGDIGDCGVGISLQICNRVTNHGDIDTFSKPVLKHAMIFL